MAIKKPQYREQVSQLISWGHWFTLFNIIISLLIGSRYLFIIDWPSTLTGRIYAIVSWLGHFSFIGFTAYLLLLFPLTFIITSQRLFRFTATSYATGWLTLLLLDYAAFSRFHLHLNKFVVELVLSPEQGELARDWQLLFIAVPLLFLVLMLLSTWSWQKLRSLQRRTFARPIVILLFCSFVASHLMYIWADANFYRPITMQKANLPLSYPMTARSFLQKHGMLNAQEYQRRLMEQGDPAAMSIDYPRSDIRVYADNSNKYNLLLIMVDGLRAQDIAQDMPHLAAFARQNINFTRHFSSGNRSDTGLFGLFYGIAPIYIDGIIAGKKPSALLVALEKQGYQLGLFSSTGFAGPLYRQALFADISLPLPYAQSNATTTAQWQQWMKQRNINAPWFSYIDYRNALKNSDAAQADEFIQRYRNNARVIDNEIGNVLTTLQRQGMLENTVVVISAKHGVEFGDSGDNHWGSGQDFGRPQFQVPLVIHWPGITNQSIDNFTQHQDIMRTLMQRVLRVTTPPYDYTQGEDLFSTQRQNNWLTLGDNKNLVIVTPTQTLVLTNSGHYRIYDLQDHREKQAQLPLSLVLQVLTDVKRFISD